MIIQGPDLEYLDKWWKVEYHDCDTFDDTPPNTRVAQIYTVALHQGRLLIGLGPRRRWALLGGTPKPGETYEQTLYRKLLAEANVAVRASQPLGYQVLTHSSEQLLQLRAVSIVEPLGPFVEDPGGKISLIKFVNPQDYRNYFQWGDVSDHLIRRGLELAARM